MALPAHRCPPAQTPRTYIRHPAGMAIDVQTQTGVTDFLDLCIGYDQSEPIYDEHLKDISLGGLACSTKQAHTKGEIVRVTISCTCPPFEVSGRIVWCEKVDSHTYDVGIQFLAVDDAFAARMVEQICHIENYRQQVFAQEGRDIDSETAAREWIGHFADSFPDPQAMH